MTFYHPYEAEQHDVTDCLVSYNDLRNNENYGSSVSRHAMSGTSRPQPPPPPTWGATVCTPQAAPVDARDDELKEARSLIGRGEYAETLDLLVSVRESAEEEGDANALGEIHRLEGMVWDSLPSRVASGSWHMVAFRAGRVARGISGRLSAHLGHGERLGERLAPLAARRDPGPPWYWSRWRR